MRILLSLACIIISLSLYSQDFKTSPIEYCEQVLGKDLKAAKAFVPKDYKVKTDDFDRVVLEKVVKDDFFRISYFASDTVECFEFTLPIELTEDLVKQSKEAGYTKIKNIAMPRRYMAKKNNTILLITHSRKKVICLVRIKS